MDDEIDAERDQKDQYVVYPIFASHNNRTFEIARDIADGAGMTLLVLDLLDAETDVVDESRHVGRAILDNRLDDEHDVDTVSRFEATDSPVETTIEVVSEHDTRLIVFDEHTPEGLLEPLGTSVEQRISADVSCDSVVVERAQQGKPEKILVPYAGGPHSGVTVSVAGALAQSVDASIELVHVTRAEETASHYFDQAREYIPEDVTVKTRHVSNPSVVDAIVEASGRVDATVIGEPTRSRLKQLFFGSVTDDVIQQTSGTVLVCRRAGDGTFAVQGSSP